MTVTEQMQRIRLFVISYGPLWVMLALRTWPESEDWRWRSRSAWVTGGLVVAAIWSFLDAWRLIRGALRKGAIRMRFTEVRDEGSAASGYLATYLVPLLAEAPTRPGVWFAYGLYALMVVVLFIRTDLALVNPTLYAFGWRVVSAVPVREAQPAQAVVVVCRSIRTLQTDTDVVRLAGCYITKNETGFPGARH